MIKLKYKKLIGIALLLVIFGSIGTIFWYSEWIYNLPTPVPSNYKNVANGTVIDLNSRFPFQENKPVFIHFFNPECPCSRFNIQEFRAIVKENSKNVNFAVVVLSEKQHSAREIQKKINLQIPVIFDEELAAQCGVYSTPQAVILDNNSKLYYRGNYNRSRYCTDKRTRYASIALNNLINHQKHFSFDKFALKAYGCTLPGCSE